MNFIRLIILILCFQYINAYANCPANIKKEVENYLKTLDKVAITFTQKSGAKESKGILLVKKPDSFRLNYEDQPIVIIGGKKYLSLYNYNVDQLSRTDADKNPLKFLLENDFENIDVHKCKKTGDKISLDISDDNTKQLSKIQFSLNPIRVTSVSTCTNLGPTPSTTKIKFEKIIFANNLPNDLFNIRDPKIYGPPKKYTSKELLDSLR